MDFAVRSHLAELLDQPNIPPADIERNLYELSIINGKLGGHALHLDRIYCSLQKKECHYMYARSVVVVVII